MASSSSEPRSFVIPTGVGDESIIIPANELPEDANEIIEVLTAVAAPPKLWLEILIEYWRRDKVVQFDELLRKALPLVNQKCACARSCRVPRGKLLLRQLPPPPPALPSLSLISPHASSSPSAAMSATDPETRLKMWTTTAVYELLYGSKSTRKLIAEDSSAVDAKDADIRAQNKQHVAAEKFIVSINKYVEKYVNPLHPVPGATGSTVQPLAFAPLGPAVSAAGAFYKWNTQKEQLSILKLQGGAGAGQGGWAAATAASITEENVAGFWAVFVKEVQKIADAAKRNGPAASMFSRVPHAIGQALIAWHAGNFADARAHFAAAILANGNCGAGPRVGLALCLLRLGHVEPAKMALKRAIEVEPSYAPALAAFAYVESHAHALAIAAGTASDETAANADEHAIAALRGVGYAKEALSRSPNNAQALLELSDSYFRTWNEVIAPASGVPVSVIATRGSHRLVLSDPTVLSRFRGGEWIKVVTSVKGKTVLVPMRLAARDFAITVSSAAALGLVNPDVPTTGELAVLVTRAPWGPPSKTGLKLRALDVQLAEKQARQAISATRSEAVRGEAYYCLGRALHAQGKELDAAIQFRLALRINKDHVATLTGLAQCEAKAAERKAATEVDTSVDHYAEAIKLLERALLLRPEDFTALKALAGIYSRKLRLDPRLFDTALDYARRASELAPWDATVAALYALLLCKGEGKASAERAHRASVAANDRLKEQGIFVPIALLCNIGLLHCRIAGYKTTAKERAEEMQQADDVFQRALAQAASMLFPGAPLETLTSQEGRDRAMLSPQGVTVGFNLARLREMQGRLAEATSIYQKSEK